MHKVLQRLFLFEKFEMKTKLSKEEACQKLKNFIADNKGKYYGHISEKRFFISRKSITYHRFGRSQNPFAPVWKGTIIEQDGMTIFFGVMRMNIIMLILFVPLYLVCLLFIIPFPIIHLIIHFLCFKPAKQLKEELEFIL